MIIANGTIEFLTSVGGGIDEVTGHPKPVTAVTAGKSIPCQIVSARLDAQARSREGEAVMAVSWEVYIEQLYRAQMTSERVRLRDRSGKELGKYSIIRVEPLDAVGEYRITL